MRAMHIYHHHIYHKSCPTCGFVSGIGDPGIYQHIIHTIEESNSIVSRYLVSNAKPKKVKK